MATAATTRPSGPVLSIPNYGCASPNRVKLAAAVGARSPTKSNSVSSLPASSPAVKSRRSCMCSPTNHPGSFRCSLHKELKNAQGAHSKPAPCAHSKGKPVPGGHPHAKPASPPSPHPSFVVPTGSGARVLARRAIAPSQQSQNRRRVAAAGSFRPRPSRLSAVSYSGDGAVDSHQ